MSTKQQRNRVLSASEDLARFIETHYDHVGQEEWHQACSIALDLALEACAACDTTNRTVTEFAMSHPDLYDVPRLIADSSQGSI